MAIRESDQSIADGEMEALYSLECYVSFLKCKQL